MAVKRILVLGGGPAGGAVALGLVRLGYRVGLICEPRPFVAVEGVSERVVEGLRGAGCERALDCLPPPSPRQVTWNGQTSAANTERLIERRLFDAGIEQDLLNNGVELIRGRVGKVSTEPDISVSYRTDQGEQRLAADFLVEARGRSAPSAHLQRLRGAETVSLLQYWRGGAGQPKSAVQSFADGWAWLAQAADGTRYLQLTFDVASSRLPPKERLVEYCTERLRTLEQAQPFLAGAEPTGELHARTSTPILCRQAVGDNWIRVGDAAMAVDPLSGNGIFQALSSALQAPAVINTLLQQPENGALAKQFHQQRVDSLFYRFARIGRDFYAMESQWPQRPFWQQRRRWPDRQPVHLPPDRAAVEVKTQPVVENGLIRPAEVVVTPDQPLGIWHLVGIELAPLVKAAQRCGGGESLEQVIAQRKLPAECSQMLLHWLRQQGF
ncbi:flavin-dependent monooxygenase QhpG [Marinobacterium arenosum]|uniref:flavin-dependent monooxygenase QhpG n=1 Tax=Marinobacterium arenosum TaxID=2862496 RepID=UPI001C956DF0|nr:lycopene cyclase family protein [Marinobacterium arenosum]MBY4676624.1 tryptophan 7-halogenase [Marinobacterium arenosum]